jgi:chromosome segregation ATPase
MTPAPTHPWSAPRNNTITELRVQLQNAEGRISILYRENDALKAENQALRKQNKELEIQYEHFESFEKEIEKLQEKEVEKLEERNSSLERAKDEPLHTKIQQLEMDRANLVRLLREKDREVWERDRFISKLHAIVQNIQGLNAEGQELLHTLTVDRSLLEKGAKDLAMGKDSLRLFD